MSEDALAFILKSDGLRMDEIDIVEKVTEWATVRSACHHISCFFFLIRYTLISFCHCTSRWFLVLHWMKQQRMS